MRNFINSVFLSEGWDVGTPFQSLGGGSLWYMLSSPQEVAQALSVLNIRDTARFGQEAYLLVHDNRPVMVASIDAATGRVEHAALQGGAIADAGWSNYLRALEKKLLGNDIIEEALGEEDFYELRRELEPGMVFVDVDGDLVKLEQRVEGDGSKWIVSVWWGNSWSYEENMIEPGDLRRRARDPSIKESEQVNEIFGLSKTEKAAKADVVLDECKDGVAFKEKLLSIWLSDHAPETDLNKRRPYGKQYWPTARKNGITLHTCPMRTYKQSPVGQQAVDGVGYIFADDEGKWFYDFEGKPNGQGKQATFEYLHDRYNWDGVEWLDTVTECNLEEGAPRIANKFLRVNTEMHKISNLPTPKTEDDVARLMGRINDLCDAVLEYAERRANDGNHGLALELRHAVMNARAIFPPDGEVERALQNPHTMTNVRQAIRELRAAIGEAGVVVENAVGSAEVYDRNGRILKPGDRIRYVLPDYYINTKSGTGTVVEIDRFGGIYYDADTPEPVRDRHGGYREKRQRQYTSSTYDYKTRRRIAAGKLGDPFEHGQVDTFVEVID